MRKTVMLSIVLVFLMASAAGAAIVERSVEYTQDGVTLEGYLAYDDSIKGKRPGVLVIHQWMGLTDYEKMRSRMLAELGYVAFAADIYGKGIRPDDNNEAKEVSATYRDNRKLLRARAQAALKQLKAQKGVDNGNIAVIGYCFGGTAALELARDGADVRGTVTFHGGLSTPTPEDAKNIKGKVLALHGSADQAVLPAEVSAFQKEMSDAGVDWYMEIYAYAQHAFTQKGARYNESADLRSWRSMKSFFGEIFKQ